jgi:hypothetical protein
MTQPDVKLKFYPQFFLDLKKKKKNKEKRRERPSQLPSPDEEAASHSLSSEGGSHTW